MMAAIRQDLLRTMKSLAPPLTFDAHKGQAGRIGIIGGSVEYTGAPYFAAITAMRLGADLGHVFCPKDAAPVIKAYSPDLIVHPNLSDDTPSSTADIATWFPRLHALVIGPGLGRDPNIMNTVKSLLQVAKSQEKDLVIDADGLHLIHQDPELVMNYDRSILTPNAVEFTRLYEKLLGHRPRENECSIEELTKNLALSMGGVTIVRKGHHDVISNGAHTLTCIEDGTPKRQGGQGDLLSGSMGVLLYWARLAESKSTIEVDLPVTMLAAYTGCLLVKKSAHITYNRLGRSMLASDMIDDIGGVACDFFDK